MSAPGNTGMDALADAWLGNLESEERPADESTAPEEGERAPEPESDPDEPAEDAPLESPQDEEDEDAEPDEEEEGDEEEGDEPSAEASSEDVYVVNVAGEEKEVPISELVAGYQRQSDYTRKTQALADERRSLESERGRASEELNQRLESVTQLAAQLHRHVQMFGDNPQEMQRLLEEDPQEYMRRDLVNRERTAAIQAAEQEIARANEEAFRAALPREKEKLLQRIPSWQDTDTLQREFKEVEDLVLGFDIAPDEWNRLKYDHRFVSLAHMALGQHKANKAAPTFRKRVAKAPKIAQGGTRAQVDGRERSARKTRGRLRKSGSVDDLAALLLEGGAID